MYKWMDGAGMFTIAGVMSFGGTAPLLNLLVALCLRHCGKAPIFRSRSVHVRLEQGKVDTHLISFWRMSLTESIAYAKDSAAISDSDIGLRRQPRFSQPAISDEDWGLLSRSSNAISSPHAHLRCKVPASQKANPSRGHFHAYSNAAIRRAPAFAIKRRRRVQLGELHTENVDCSRPVGVSLVKDGSQPLHLLYAL
jgi:hypothetical protein